MDTFPNPDIKISIYGVIDVSMSHFSNSDLDVMSNQQFPFLIGIDEDAALASSIRHRYYSLWFYIPKASSPAEDLQEIEGVFRNMSDTAKTIFLEARKRNICYVRVCQDGEPINTLPYQD